MMRAMVCSFVLVMLTAWTTAWGKVTAGEYPRCREYAVKPPPRDWNGVAIMTEK